MYEWVHTMCTNTILVQVCVYWIWTALFGFIALYLLTFTWYTVGTTIWSLPWEVHSFRRDTNERGCLCQALQLKVVSFACSADPECRNCNLIGRFNTSSARVAARTSVLGVYKPQHWTSSLRSMLAARIGDSLTVVRTCFWWLRGSLLACGFEL